MTKSSTHSQSLRSRFLPALALAAFLFAQLANTVHANQLDNHAAGQLCEFCLLFSQNLAALPATAEEHEGVDTVQLPTVAIADVHAQQTSLHLPQVRAPPVQSR